MALLDSVVVLVDLISLLLDLNFIIVHRIVGSLLAALRFVHSLPTLCLNSCLLVGSSLTGAVVTMSGSLVLALEGLLEATKMVGYLSIHVVVRGRDYLHRSVESVAEGCDIVVSLLVYFTNTVVNFALIAAQKLLLAVVWLLQVILSPLQKILEVALSVLTCLYSGLFASAAFVWPLLDLSASFVQMFCSVFILDFYGLMVTLAVALTTTAYLYPQPARRRWSRLLRFLNSFPGTRRLRDASLGFLASCVREGQEVTRAAEVSGRRLLRLLSVSQRRLWRDLSHGGVQIRLILLTRLQRVNDEHSRRANGDGGPGVERRAPPDGRAEEETHGDVGGGVGGKPENLLTLLTEQEERKKCVICKDCVKTVVLLPCRHLCLCRDCMDLLKRQPVYQHNCPLCRRIILNSVDVYL